MQRVVESHICGAINLNGKRCKRHTLKGDKCWNHLMKYDHLRIKKSGIPNAGFGLFATKKFPKDAKVIDYLGTIHHHPIIGPYVLELNPHKFVDAANSKYVGGYSNTCRNNNSCTNNAKLTGYQGVGRIKTKKTILPGKEIYTSYGRNYWR